VADSLNTNSRTLSSLEKHHRDNEPWIENVQNFHESIEGFFEHPGELVYGQETANQALKRFDSAIQELLDDAQ
jgi:hypothetical protein